MFQLMLLLAATMVAAYVVYVFVTQPAAHGASEHRQEWPLDEEDHVKEVIPEA